ncbi:MAG TPA: DUF4202 domain-containing protein [Acidimicrobiales bacterium]|nr:DUF4202 domain-containing protein [Acidimicrobiales bacterium]
MSASPLAQVLATLDSANELDPRTLVVRGSSRPFCLGEAELATVWLEQLRPDASDELRIAVRAHHVRRWETPRATYPDGRAGYLRWRRHLYDVHAAHAADAMRAAGYDERAIARVDSIMHKRSLGTDPEAQAYEDALCLVFLETQFGAFAARMEPPQLDVIVAKTLAKMSDAAKAAWEAHPQVIVAPFARTRR